MIFIFDIRGEEGEIFIQFDNTGYYVMREWGEMHFVNCSKQVPSTK